MIIILKFAAGLALLIFGMKFMRDGLESAVQNRMKHALATLTKTPLAGTITGLVITMIAQSSTAITVLTIGFVNAGILNFYQAVGIILGTNIGTSITAQMMSFNLEALAVPLIGLGAILMTLFKRKSFRYLGQSIVGFGIVFLGMDIMAGAMEPVKDYPAFISALTALSNNIVLSVIAGTVFSALIHSSATTAGVVMALSLQGLISLPAAIGIVLGSNIGTCITGVLASIGASTPAKRVAAAHVMLNVIGVALFTPFIIPFADLIANTATTLPRQIANAHTIFNIASTLIVLPFTRHFANLVMRIVPDRR